MSGPTCLTKACLTAISISELANYDSKLLSSLRSKRFQSSYGAKVRAGAKKKLFFALVPTFLDELARKRLLRRLTTVLHVLDFPLPSFCLLLFTYPFHLINQFAYSFCYYYYYYYYYHHHYYNYFFFLLLLKARYVILP